MARKRRNQEIEESLLYDLEWLNENKKFPPSSQVARLERYERNKKLFESEQNEVFKDQLQRIQRLVGDLRNVFIDPVVLNYNKLLSIKTADLVCGEAPRITYENGDTTTIDQIRQVTKLDTLIYETVIDISRYGDAIWRLYKDGGKGRITIWEPKEWFPIVSPEDKKKITHHVLARRIYKGTDSQGRLKYELLVQIHEEGKYEQRTYEMKEDDTIGKLKERKHYKTGFKGFAVIHSSNVTTSDSIFGHDDYKPVNTIISELMVRFGQIQHILDKHASPAIQGPMTALQPNPKTGRWEFKMANFYAKNQDDDPVEYLTWDGNLESAFNEINKLIDQLLIISEMGSALLGSVDSAGRAVSGTTMRLRMVNPLMKARRLVDSLHDNLQTALSEISTMGYRPMKKEKIEIEWFDGLPDDPMEEANIMAIRTGNRATISQKRAIMFLDDLTDEQADEVLKEMKDEEPEYGEFQFPGMDLHDDEIEDGDN